jgi:hypothetical protein
MCNSSLARLRNTESAPSRRYGSREGIFFGEMNYLCTCLLVGLPGCFLAVAAAVEDCVAFGAGF